MHYFPLILKQCFFDAYKPTNFLTRKTDEDGRYS